MALKNIKWPDSSDDTPKGPRPIQGPTLKWRTILGLCLLYTAVVFNWQWIWGILSLYWIAPSLLTGVTYFIEPIDRREHPILFWIISITWIAFSIVAFFPVSAGR